MDAAQNGCSKAGIDAAGNIAGYNGVQMWNNTTLAITGGTMKAQGGVGIKGNSTYDNTNIKISGNTSINAKETDIYPPCVNGYTSIDNGNGTYTVG